MCDIKESIMPYVHMVVVFIFSILIPIYDAVKDWWLVIVLFCSHNYAWGTLFVVPILYGYIGQFLMWYHEEIRKKGQPEYHRCQRVCQKIPVFGSVSNLWSL